MRRPSQLKKSAFGRLNHETAIEFMGVGAPLPAYNYKKRITRIFASNTDNF